MTTQFDSVVAAYEHSMEQMPFREHIEAYSFLKAVGDVSGRSVLDLGCGSGPYTRLLRARGASRTVGMDESAAMVDYARRREDRERLGVEYIAANAAGPDGSAGCGIAGEFDVVTAVYVLPYAPTAQALEGMCRTARKALRAAGGTFVAATLNPDFSTDLRWYRAYGMELSAPSPRGEGAPGHMKAWVGEKTLDIDFFCWSAEAHEQALRAAGFSSISWIRPEVSARGRKAHGDGYWANYLACPHSLIIRAEAVTHR